VQLVKELREVTSSEFPLERLGDRFVVVLEFQESFGNRFEVGEIIGREDLALNDGKVNLDLIEPTGMNRSVDEHQARIAALESCHGTVATMTRTVVHDPEDAAGFIVRWARHDLVHEAVKRSDAIFQFAATQDAGAVDIERRQVSPGSTTLVLMFDAHRPAGSASLGSMSAGSCLDAGLLVGRNHKLIVLQGLAVPKARVEIQDAARFQGKVRVARENPSSVLPGTNGILVQPSPDRAATDLCDQAGARGVLGQVGGAPPRERKAVGGGQFTSESLHLNDQLWGEKSGAVPDEDAPPDRRGVPRRNVFARG
jgi:hypothetical protein